MCLFSKRLLLSLHTIYYDDDNAMRYYSDGCVGGPGRPKQARREQQADASSLTCLASMLGILLHGCGATGRRRPSSFCFPDLFALYLILSLPGTFFALFCLSAGPMTYFGPKHFNASGPAGFKISLDVRACQLPLPSPLFPPPLLFLPLIYVCRLGLHLLFPPPYRPPFPFDV